MNKTIRTLIAAGIIAAAPMVFAQGDDAAGSESMDQMDQMDQMDHDQMGHDMGMMHDGNMMPMMAEMNDMMKTCNEMMQGMMNDSNDAEADAGNG